MRTAILAAFATIFLASAARADDTKPPQISDVKASSRGGKVTIEARITDETGVLSATVHHRGPGGKVEDTPMVKNDYDDVFKATFSGGGETEYWIDSSDLLGNGPSTYGSASKAMAVGGAKTSGSTRVAEKEPEEPKEPPKPREHHERVAKAAQPPVIEHRKPSIQPPEGKDFTLRMKIKSESPVAVAILQAKPEGGANQNITLKKIEGESYEGTIPAAIAHGTVQYWIAAKNQAELVTRQGDGDASTPYAITFKAPPAVASSGQPAGGAQQASATSGAAQPYAFTDLPPYRVPPGKPFVVRAQVVPSSDDGQAPDKVAVLWRGADAQDQFTEMVRDDTGGYGGYKAELPEQPEGAVFYQIVACADASGTKCGVDTGSKRKWHATIVAAQPGAAAPMALDAVSSKAPPSLPE